MESDIERGVLRPTGPGDFTQWQGILFPSGDPTPDNWDVVNAETVDPSFPSGLLLSAFGAPDGITDLYNVSAHLSVAARLKDITVCILGNSFSIGPAPEGEIATVIRVAGSESQGATQKLPGDPARLTHTFQGPFHPRGDKDWLQIGIRKIAQATSMFVFQVYAHFTLEAPRKFAFPGGR